MATTYRIAVIGSWESVMGFQAPGTGDVSRHRPEELRETIRELAKSGDWWHHLSDGAAGKGPAGRAGPV